MSAATDSIHANPVPVDEAAFRTALAQLRRQQADPRAGLFGPGSMYWEVNRHTVPYFLGAVQSVQMQLCHPWIATAVFEHSKIMSNPRARQRLTYIFLWSLIYGDLDTVTRKATALYKVHDRIAGRLAGDGSAYHANEVSALLWVHVTAFYCRVLQYEQLVKPLGSAERDRFCAEAKLYAYCFGIPAHTHPQNWQEVEDYIAAMAQSTTLARTDGGMKIRLFLENSIPRPLRGALWNYLCMPLPARMQALLDQPAATPENLARAAATRRWLAHIEHALPAVLRYVPAWHEAMARIDGRAGAGWLVERMNQLMLGVPRLVV